MTGATHARRRCNWDEALILPGQPDLRTSLIAELADHLGVPTAEVSARCLTATADLARAWHATAPSTAEEITAFHRGNSAYLYDLTREHALERGDNVPAQVEALELALARRPGAVLDFGSGIGSLGLSLARHGLDVTLAEVNPTLNGYARRRFARRGLAGRFLDTDADPLPGDAFDFVAAVDVFEHVPFPRRTLKDLAGTLRPGGTLFVHMTSRPGVARPMRLWRRPEVLLEHLAEAGLWLEDEGGSSLVLRRGTTPVYKLNSGLELRPDDRGGVLLSSRPLVAIRMNPLAVDLLSRLDRARSVAELASTTGLPVTDVGVFLERLADRRILVKEPGPVQEWPSVSLIVPARNRPSETQACVESLLALDYPPDRVEIIVVDDASRVPLASAVAAPRVRVLREEMRAGPAAARNLAAGEARGTVLAFLDNDCVADPRWLARLVPWLCDPAVDVVGGRVVSPTPDGAVAAFEAARSPLDMGASGGRVGPGETVTHLPACNLLVRREALRRLGGFDPGMEVGEDADLVWRAARAGLGVFYEPAGEVVHRHRTRLGPLLRRRADYGSSEADLQLRHPQARRTMVVPGVGATLLAALALAPVARRASPFLASLAGLVIGAEGVSKLRRMSRSGVRIPTRRVGGAVLRQHGAAMYHLGANVARYYGLPLLGVSLLWRPLLPPTLALLLIPPVTDHRLHRPPLALWRFVGLYWSELAAYQVGVWRGCVEQRTLRPFLAALRLGR